jgi:Zn-dependent protease
MHRYLRYGIVEDVDTVRHIPAGSILGVRVSITPWTWAGPGLFFGLGLVLNLWSLEQSWQAGCLAALLFMLGVEVATVIHALGHICSGTVAGSPMDELLVTATRDVNIYHGDQRQYPPRVHLLRALGGPLANLLLAGLLIAAASQFPPGLLSEVVTRLISINLFFGLGSLLPVPSIDGSVIWPAVMQLARGQRARSSGSQVAEDDPPAP